MELDSLLVSPEIPEMAIEAVQGKTPVYEARRWLRRPERPIRFWSLKIVFSRKFQLFCIIVCR